MAAGASEVSTSTSCRSAVSWLERQTSLRGGRRKEGTVRGRRIGGGGVAAALAVLAVLGAAPSALAAKPGPPAAARAAPDEALVLASTPGGSDGVIVRQVSQAAAL